MGYIVKMPKLGLEMESGTLVDWKIEVDEAIEEGDVLAEVESEKSIGEIEAREAGTLRRVYVEEGGEVPPGTPIGIVAAPDADIADLEAEAEAELDEKTPDATAAGSAESAEGEVAAAAEAGEAEAGTTDGEEATAKSTTGGRKTDVKASPRAKKRADELGVDLTTVEGTGPMGSITEADVETAAESEADEAETAEDVKASPRAKKRADELGVDLTTVEGTGPMGSVTEADVEAAAQAEAEVSPPEAGAARWVPPDDDATNRYQRVTAVADPSAATALFETMEAVRTAFEERVTVTDVLVVVASATLADHPVVNGTYTEATHHIQETQDIALVADTGGDLVTGVISDVRNRSLSYVVDTRRALDGTSGGGAGEQATFTLANAAETDGEGRLVNPPGVVALTVDPTGQRAVPDGDGIDLQPLVTASLTYDTRAVGRTDATAFVEQFFRRAEQASELVLESYRGRE